MITPEYKAPESLEDALAVKEQYGSDARVLAGGTDLILRLRDRILEPRLLLDLRRVSLTALTYLPGEIRLGAYVTLGQIMASAEATTALPAMASAGRAFAGPPIRNLATVGGNIVNASPAADLVPPLLAYDASVVLLSSTARRIVPLMRFFTGPGQTVMKPDEILAEIRVPLPPRDTASSFAKLGQRRSMAISVVNLSTRLTLDSAQRVSDARIVLGSVAPTAIRAQRAEAMLIGEKLSDELIGEAAAAASSDTSPICDVRGSRDYRKRMTAVLVRRALIAARNELEGVV